MKVTKATPVSERAGTKLDHRFTVPVNGERNGRTINFGTLDTSQRVYQHGGDLSKLVFWKRKCAAFGPEEWQALQGNVDYIELIDHNTNKCYRIDYETAAANMFVYNGGIGDRYGVPLDLFTVYDVDWNVL